MQYLAGFMPNENIVEGLEANIQKYISKIDHRY